MSARASVLTNGWSDRVAPWTFLGWSGHWFILAARQRFTLMTKRAPVSSRRGLAFGNAAPLLSHRMSTPHPLSIWARNVSPSPTLAVDAKAKALKPRVKTSVVSPPANPTSTLPNTSRRRASPRSKPARRNTRRRPASSRCARPSSTATPRNTGSKRPRR